MRRQKDKIPQTNNEHKDKGTSAEESHSIGQQKNNSASEVGARGMNQ